MDGWVDGWVAGRGWGVDGGTSRGGPEERRGALRPVVFSPACESLGVGGGGAESAVFPIRLTVLAYVVVVTEKSYNCCCCCCQAIGGCAQPWTGQEIVVVAAVAQGAGARVVQRKVEVGTVLAPPRPPFPARGFVVGVNGRPCSLDCGGCIETKKCIPFPAPEIYLV